MQAGQPESGCFPAGLQVRVRSRCKSQSSCALPPFRQRKAIIYRIYIYNRKAIKVSVPISVLLLLNLLYLFLMETLWGREY